MAKSVTAKRRAAAPSRAKAESTKSRRGRAAAGSRKSAASPSRGKSAGSRSPAGTERERVARARLVGESSAPPAVAAGVIRVPSAAAVPPAGYRPSEAEPYMCPAQLAYFRTKLAASRADIEASLAVTVAELQSESPDIGDDADRATVEHYHSVRIHEKSRQHNLLHLIDAALHRIDTGTYGYCAETGEPIGLARLEARPTAVLSLDAQERHEYGKRTAFGT